jgi:uncharacterized membrane protein YvbJ
MYCPKCGWNNADDAAKCSNCFAEMAPGQPQPTQQTPQQQPYAQQPYGQQQQQYGAQPVMAVPDYMVWSIVVTVVSLFCCIIGLAFGIVGIVKSSQANNKKLVGDYQGALQDANSVKTWLYWAVGLDIVGLIGWIIYFVAVGTAMSKMGMRRNF